jgi:hypothetical protein
MTTPKKRPARTPAQPIPTLSALARYENQLLDALRAIGAWLRSHMRQRTLLVVIAPIIALALLWKTDPDGGASTQAWALRLFVVVLGAAFAHFMLKTEHDYPEADRRTLFGEVLKGNVAAAIALVAEAIVFLAFMVLVAPAVHAEPLEIQRAHTYLPMLAKEVDRTWRAHPDRTVLAGQISNETACPRVRSCWLPTAQLKSAREEGAGFGQFTRTYRADGSQRFDALTELTQRHPALSELTWANVYNRADLQLRAFLLKALDDNRIFIAVVDPRERLIFGLVSHNRGTGGVQSERRACKLSPGCDPGKWFANVELHCTASRAALYGTRSACDISRAYPKDILLRAQRYRGLV